MQGAGWAVKTEQRCTSGRRAAFWSWQPRLPTVVEQLSCQKEGGDEALSDSFPIGAREVGHTAGTKTCNFFTAYHIPGERLNAGLDSPRLEWEANLCRNPTELISDRVLTENKCEGRDALLPLPGFGRLCYNGAAVEQHVKPISAEEVTGERVFEEYSVAGESASSSSRFKAVPVENARNEDASRFCPVCSQRLESRRCKLICNVCGYYMSCADYY